MPFDYDVLCEKMGFDPMKDELPRNMDIEDDAPSPFEKLTNDELIFLEEYLSKHSK